MLSKCSSTQHYPRQAPASLQCAAGHLCLAAPCHFTRPMSFERLKRGRHDCTAWHLLPLSNNMQAGVPVSHALQTMRVSGAAWPTPRAGRHPAGDVHSPGPRGAPHAGAGGQ